LASLYHPQPQQQQRNQLMALFVTNRGFQFIMKGFFGLWMNILLLKMMQATTY